MPKQLVTKRRLAGALVVLVSIYLFAAVVLVWSGLSDEIGQADVALVLGNKVSPEGVPSERLAARLDRAESLYKEGYFKKIIVSGGTGVEGYPEGDAMRDYLIGKGVPKPAIIVDNQGNNTEASAENTLAILKSANLKSVMVITQYFHVPRSKLALRRLGVAPVYGAHAHYFEIRDFYSVFREVPAYLLYAIR